MIRKVLIIGYVWPEPQSSAAGVRMLQLIRAFRSADIQVIFSSPAAPGEHPFDLSQMGVSSVTIQVNDPGFDDFARETQPDLVVFDRYMMEEQFGWRIAEQCPEAIRVLDTEDLHFLRKYRQKNYRSSFPDHSNMLLDPLARREVASIYRCDLSLIISQKEMELLTGQFGVDEKLLCYLPYLLDAAEIPVPGSLNGFEQRKDMMFIGNFRHDPNTDAVRYLKVEIWPEIRKVLPGVSLSIYGAYAGKEVEEMHKPSEGFNFRGWTPDVKDVMLSHRVLLAPLRFGGGLKGKIVDGMRFGLPAVTTTTGAEGLEEMNTGDGRVTDEAAEFVRTAVRLYADEKFWNNAVSVGYDVVSNKFDRNYFERILMRRLNALRIDLSLHRQLNFIGGMLSDQRVMASKYLSKYIVEKNRNN
ncbi:glycosyltransferase [Robertkochia solimangrovi]|uniref:glycosyltransferase n=1 Tax=Robertkochia solimangrovi TaxID=2213046 RepID=UPI001180D0D1|nr:glycosyltransferase family 4 protein [Robertkochia solimangrovi]TRZ45178.1 glycosyltransferase [Robertkochia solimangrovi]